MKRLLLGLLLCLPCAQAQLIQQIPDIGGGVFTSSDAYFINKNFAALNTLIVVPVIADPTGSCTLPQALQFNTNNGDLSGCEATSPSLTGTWATIGGGGGGGTPGGTGVQIQYRLNGTTFGGFTMSGDCTLVVGTGAITCVNAGGVPIVTTTGTQSLTNKTVDGVTPATMAFVDPTSSVQAQLNGKQQTLTLTTTGSSGAATLGGGTLNIPQYTGGGGGSVGACAITGGGTASLTVTITAATNVCPLTLSANATTVTISGGGSAGDSIAFAITQGASLFTMAAPTGFTPWPGASQVVSTVSNFTCWNQDGTNWSCGAASATATNGQTKLSAAPVSPPAGTIFPWCDTTDLDCEFKNSAGTIFKSFKSGVDCDPVTGICTTSNSVPIVTTTGTQTLTNKSLTSPAMTGTATAVNLNVSGALNYSSASTYTGSATPDLSISNFTIVTASGANVTITAPTNPHGSGPYWFQFVNDTTARTWTFPGTFKGGCFPGAASQSTLQAFLYDGTNYNAGTCFASEAGTTRGPEAAILSKTTAAGFGAVGWDSSQHDFCSNENASGTYACMAFNGVTGDIVTYNAAGIASDSGQLLTGVTKTIGSGTINIGAQTVASGACSSALTATITGTAATDTLMADFNADPTGIVGWQASTNGMMAVIKYPTTNTANVKLCNNTGASITTGTMTLNVRVVR